MADWLDSISNYFRGDGSAGSDGGMIGRMAMLDPQFRAAQEAKQRQQLVAQALADQQQQRASFSQLFNRPVEGTPWVTPAAADAVNNAPQDPNITAPPAVAGGAVGKSPFEAAVGPQSAALAPLIRAAGPTNGLEMVGSLLQKQQPRLMQAGNAIVLADPSGSAKVVYQGESDRRPTQFELMTEGLTPDEKRKAARIGLGLDAGPGSDVGKVPVGYRMKADGTMEFIPGGPADPAVAGNDITGSEKKELFKIDGEIPQLQESLRNLYELRKISDNAPSGVGASRLLDFQQGMANFRNDPELKERVQNGFRFNKVANDYVVQGLKALFGGRITNMELQNQSKNSPNLDMPAEARGQLIDDLTGKLERSLLDRQARREAIAGGNLTKFTPGAAAGNQVGGQTRTEAAAPPVVRGNEGGPGQPKDLVAEARRAIANGKDRGKVLERLKALGVTPPGDL